MALTGKKVVILVENQYQDLEVWYPLMRLREEKVKVIVAGTGSSKLYNGKYGYPIEVDCDAKDIRAEDIDGLIIPGGWAPDFLRRYGEVSKLVREADEKKKIIGSICHGASVLVSAGILKGRTITCFKAIKDDVVYAGAKYVDEEVVVDGNLVTSRKPDDLPAFCRKIVEMLNNMP